MRLHQLQTLLSRSGLVVGDEKRKSLVKMAREACDWWFRKREIPTAYFYNLHYTRAHTDPIRYLSNRQWRAIVTATKQPNRSVFRNKLLFQKTFRNTGVRLPRYIGHLGYGFYYDSESTFTPVSNERELTQLLERVLLGSEWGSLFAKPVIGYGGHGALLVSRKEQSPTLFVRLRRSSYLVQERVRQHPALDEIYAEAANTLRIVTFLDAQGRVKVVSARARFGMGGIHVDNSTSGGFFAGVDLATGRIKTPGIRPLNTGGGCYRSHPDTGFPLLDWEFPHFEAALDMAKLGTRLTSYPLVGWDVAIAEDGPVVLEGNTSLDLASDELTEGPWAIHPVLGPFVRSVLGLDSDES